MTVLNILLAASPVLSAVGSVSAVALVRGRWRVDEFTVRKLRREADEQAELRDRQRREEDLARQDALRREMAALTKRNNEQFDENLELREEVSDLRQELIELREWVTIAASQMRKAELEVPPLPPPRMARRRAVVRDSATDIPS